MSIKHGSGHQGFALIVTVSMMVLLALLAVGLLSLSSVALRSSSQGADQATARANARLALDLAIGDLQKFAGPDTRVTARADILDEDNPPVTGVWRSWEGEDHELTGAATGRPIAPDYEKEKEEHFLSWLVSGEHTEVPETESSNTKVTLVGNGSVGVDRIDQEIHLEATKVEQDGSVVGGYAWWVSGENQKARLAKPSDPSDSTNTDGQWAANLKSHAMADPDVFRLGAIVDDASLVDKMVSLKQGDLFAEPSDLPVSQEFYHDLSTNSVGLLTNVATGGWKKDLSLFTEQSGLETEDLPMFRVAPGQDSLANMATPESPRADKSMLYPWSKYRGTGEDIPIYQHGPVTSWANLKDYALAYTRMEATQSGKATIADFSEPNTGDSYKFLHKVRVLPVVARFQWVYSHSAAPSTQDDAEDGDLEGRLLVTPVLTLWNPYNVELHYDTAPQFFIARFVLYKPLPVALSYSVNGSPSGGRFRSIMDDSLNHTPPLKDRVIQMEYYLNDPVKLMPGEARVYSPESPRPVPANNEAVKLKPGYRARGGQYFPIFDDEGNVVAGSPSTRIKPSARFDTEFADEIRHIGIDKDGDEETGVGVYLDLMVRMERHLSYRMIYTPELARELYPEISGMTEVSLEEAKANPRPFLTTIFGARMANQTHSAAKGLVQSSPLVTYTAMGGKDLAHTTINRHYLGTSHPVNSPFDYSFHKLSQNDSLLPNSSDTTNRGYIVTGTTKADGLSRCVIAELPTRPLQSLGELQHWNLRYDNPVPPFSFNSIGNSDASPLLPSDAVVNGGDAGLATNLQHDDSYCANHLLFDDWFFSSIAPDPENIGTSGRTQKKVYQDLIQGTAPIPNQAYRAILEDVAFAATSSAGADELYQQYIEPSDSWQTISSRLEVEGMFNVNSTSVTAWRALLGHARNQEIPYIDASAESWSVARSEPTDHAFSRLSISGEVEATESGSSGAFPEASEFTGYRKFDEEQVDRLAEEIVKQVRMRGPFLSLSEFVNRQLSSGDLALAGAIQSALNELARDSSSNPYAVIEDVISKRSEAKPQNAADAEYQFEDAAVGHSSYGLPGWTRQADILRPLAPTLTARDDTFTIRGYGDARDATGRITATAVCEAVVQRSRDYVDPSDDASVLSLPEKIVNLQFGRRIRVVSFRWLSPSEV